MTPHHMKNINITPTVLALSLSAVLSASAAITVPGANGTDGALNITADTVIDLSLAPTGLWNSDNTPNAGKGVYDPAKWAVVFKYSSVTVAAGKTLTFKNHASRAPVVWLVSGNVTISGTVSLDGESIFAVNIPRLTEPGPGGFRGGASYFSDSVQQGSGFGVGGAFAGVLKSASYGSVGGGGPAAYGNPSLIPLIGGSGGGGSSAAMLAGGAGGGAILIATSGTAQLTGGISANGGNGKPTIFNDNATGLGSGGGVRIICENLAGSGKVNASGGTGFSNNPVVSGNGRIRLERVTNTSTISVIPAPSVVDLAAGTTALLWPPAGAPEVKIISLGGVSAPPDPRSGFGTIGADVSIPTSDTTEAIIETTNVESASQVKVRITPRDTYNFTEVAAALDASANTTPPVLRWKAALPTKLGYSAVQVKVIRP